MNTLSAHVKREPDRKPGDWAALFGISRPHFYALRDGERLPSLVVAQRIARATNGAVPIEAWPNLAAVVSAAADQTRGAA